MAGNKWQRAPGMVNNYSPLPSPTVASPVTSGSSIYLDPGASGDGGGQGSGGN